VKPFQFLQAIFLSFYSASLYQDIVKNWRGRGFLYIACLLMLGIITIGYAWYTYAKQLEETVIAELFYNSLLNNPDVTHEESITRLFHIFSKIPPLSVKNGQLESPSNTPISILDPFAPEQPIVFIDALSSSESQEIGIYPVAIVSNAIIFSPTTDTRIALYYEKIALGDYWWTGILRILSSVPELTIEGGKASLDRPSPYQVVSPSGETLLVFDTNQTSVESNRYEAPAIFLYDRALFGHTSKNKDTFTLHYDNLTKDELVALFSFLIKNIVNLFVTIGFLSLFPIWLVLFGLSCAIISLLAIVGMTIAKYLRIFHLQYRDIQRLCAVAFTPVLVLKAILPPFAFSNLFLFIVAVGYVYFAIRSNKSII
jgi:hypothetical protein